MLLSATVDWVGLIESDGWVRICERVINPKETEVPQSQDPTHPHVAKERTMIVDDLLQLVPKLITKVKKMEDVLKRRHVVLPDSEDEDAEISSKQGRNLQEEGLDEMVRNMMKDKSKVKYKRRKESKGKDIDTGFEDISTGFEDINTGFEEVNTGSIGVSTEDWDAIRVSFEANAELTKNVLGKELPEEDFAKKMVELVNQRKKFFAEERAKARRTTKAQLNKIWEKSFRTIFQRRNKGIDVQIQKEKVGYAEIWNQIGLTEDAYDRVTYGVISDLIEVSYVKDACQSDAVKMKLSGWDK
ncbi:hypothetical protein Tco_1456457 [Tanacetum coccineum]